jgi:hypothetical protein
MSAPEMEHLQRAIKAVQKSLAPEPYVDLPPTSESGEDVLAKLARKADEASEPLDAPYDLSRTEAKDEQTAP